MAVVTAGTQTWLTIFVTTFYNVVLGWAVFTGLLKIQDFIMAVGPVNTMVMGFWLGGEAALRDPRPRPPEGPNG